MRPAMSVNGPKRTFRQAQPMSAFGGKADITRWAQERASAPMPDRTSRRPSVKGCKGKTITDAQARLLPALLLAVSTNKGGTVK
jgi:hypothetical protein